MARNQTVFSEIVVALGIIGAKYDDFKSLHKIKNVDASAVKQYQEELAKRMSKRQQRSVELLLGAGKLIREWLDGRSVSYGGVSWTGAGRQGSIDSVAKDIEILDINWRVSVKEEADVFINGSPERIINQISKGDFVTGGRNTDWFRKVAPKELNDYYIACGGPSFTTAASIDDFYRDVPRHERKKFGAYVAGLHSANTPATISAYALLCEKVSVESANIFNKNMALSVKSKKSKQGLHNAFHQFFRINGVRYILAGVDKRRSFAVMLPSSEEWGKRYDFVGINASPRKAGQPEILLEFSFRDKDSKLFFSQVARLEIRWSHGKFCGNPECKVYKTWANDALPWCESI